ncbi:hypothetical protein QCA50_020330 [Cerrena zonata]|uniref:Uncharacterized protein n=1 Tax=Cerrena zonata TaxID=2478898 RepID=A0AAW0FGK9_9APHY
MSIAYTSHPGRMYMTLLKGKGGTEPPPAFNVESPVAGNTDEQFTNGALALSPLIPTRELAFNPALPTRFMSTYV